MYVKQADELEKHVNSINIGQVYAMEDTGELFLMEGVGAQEWYDELEASKFVMEETRPYQYTGYYTNLKEENGPASVPELTMPSFSFDGAKAKFMIASSLSLITLGTYV